MLKQFLQQLTAITFPLVGQLCSLAFIAVFARYYQIARIVGAAAINGDNMINLISAIKFLATPIAFLMLSLELALDVFVRICTTYLLKFSASSRSSYPTIHLYEFRMKLSAFVVRLFARFEMRKRIQTITFSAPCVNRFAFLYIFSATYAVGFFGISLPALPATLIVSRLILVPPALTVFFLFARMILSPLGSNVASALFTAIHMPVGFVLVFVEFDEEFGLATVATRFGRSVHSVSLSLYHMMVSADGVICRRFGYPLADMNHYTAKLGGVQ